MKKRCLILALSFLTIIFVENYTFAEATIKFGFDMAGNHKVSVEGLSNSEDVNMGISLSGEYVSNIDKNIGMGFGMTFQMPRSQKNYSGNFNFIPVYGLVRINSISSEVSPYFIGQLGYNLFYMGDNAYRGSGSLSGGIYYGIGAGLLLQSRSQIEILYSVNKGSYKLAGYPNFDIEYSKITLSFGFNVGK